jgi:serine/threonine-protein phosphatase 5
MELFGKEETLVDVRLDDLEEITVCGDIHGQYYDLLNIFKINGSPSEDNPYMFNGDFVDRGSFSVEVILTLLSWKCVLPQHFHMNRGNHEAQTLTSMYGFKGEVQKKYCIKTYQLFC